MGRCEQRGEKQRRHLRPRPPEGPSHLCRKSLAAAGLGTKDKETSSWLEAPRAPSPELDSRAPAAKMGSGHHRRAHPRDGWPSKRPRHVTILLRQHTVSKRGGAGGGGEAEGRGELATPTAQGLHPGQPHQEAADTPLSITFQV